MAPYCCMQYASLKKCEAAVSFLPGSGNRPHAAGGGALQLYPPPFPGTVPLVPWYLNLSRRKKFSARPPSEPVIRRGNTVLRDGSLDDITGSLLICCVSFTHEIPPADRTSRQALLSLVCRGFVPKPVSPWVHILSGADKPGGGGGGVVGCEF